MEKQTCMEDSFAALRAGFSCQLGGVNQTFPKKTQKPKKTLHFKNQTSNDVAAEASDDLSWHPGYTC